MAEIDRERMVIANALLALTKGKVVQAVRAVRKAGLELELLEPPLGEWLAARLAAGDAGTILSVIYHGGSIKGVSVLDLLKTQYRHGDYAGFLKQCLRFRVFEEVEEEVNQAATCLGRKFADQEAAWRRKFAELQQEKEAERLHEAVPSGGARSLTLDRSLQFAGAGGIKKPQKGPASKSEKSPPALLGLETLVRRERANSEHSRALSLLVSELAGVGLDCRYTKLIDAFCLHQEGLAIFEVKSITPSNERSQIRSAVSQLYEYRFLYGLKHGSLWIVLSAEPESLWVAEYLTSDRAIELVWLNQSILEGPSIARFRRLS